LGPEGTGLRGWWPWLGCLTLLYACVLGVCGGWGWSGWVSVAWFGFLGGHCCWRTAYRVRCWLGALFFGPWLVVGCGWVGVGGVWLFFEKCIVDASIWFVLGVLCVV